MTGTHTDQVEVVVFDLGNVLIRWDPFPAIAAGMGPAEAGRFLAAEDFDFQAWNHEQDAGRDWLEAEDSAARSHPHWEEHIRAYRQNFEHSLVGTIHDTVAVLEDLHRAGVRLAALTNWSHDLFPVARERYAFLEYFDEIVVSGTEGLAKPDPAIFGVLADRLQVPQARCVFVDDKQENVAAAEAAGMDAILFHDTGHLRTDLRRRGLPV